MRRGVFKAGGGGGGEKSGRRPEAGFFPAAEGLEIRQKYPRTSVLNARRAEFEANRA